MVSIELNVNGAGSHVQCKLTVLKKVRPFFLLSSLPMPLNWDNPYNLPDSVGHIKAYNLLHRLIFCLCWLLWAILLIWETDDFISWYVWLKVSGQGRCSINNNASHSGISALENVVNQGEDNKISPLLVCFLFISILFCCCFLPIPELQWFTAL